MPLPSLAVSVGSQNTNLRFPYRVLAAPPHLRKLKIRLARKRGGRFYGQLNEGLEAIYCSSSHGCGRFSAHLSFKILAALATINLVYSAAEDFIFGGWQGVMSAVGT